MKTLLRLLPLLTLLCCAALLARAEDLGNVSPVGLWKNDDAKFEIFDSGGKLGAKIVSLTQPNTPEGKPKTDIHNPDASRHGDSLLGMVFMRGFTPAGNGRWENGTIYDPKTGKTYSCYMQLENKDTIRVRGFIGISALGRTQIWTRVK
ncbi:MAG: DUF2147 domain-containing protein [Verrucomicrobia bacterium]|nr:DUF2147 domain-containing protein [Verrucomicrobiota bacterium]MBV9658615.1 DUF2147 domain-containing protein [Verrucomicrobiota bacterium]